MSEWDPEPAKLRDGEEPDISTHTQRNLAQIRTAVTDGVLDESDAEAAIAELLNDN